MQIVDGLTRRDCAEHLFIHTNSDVYRPFLTVYYSLFNMELLATQGQLESEVLRSPDEIRRRYSENRGWRFYPKEWIYKNIPVQGKEVLDFGCGTGEISTQLAFLGAKKVYALDVTPGLLDCTRRRAELDGVSDQIETICAMIQEVRPRPVDVIVAFAVLHHCFPLENVLPSLLSWLKPGGVFVAVEPVTYVPAIENIRQNSGIPFDPLDEGERKLNAADLRHVAGHFSAMDVVHFHILGRLNRLWPAGDALYCRLDQALLKVPGASKLAGSALIVGRR